MTAKATRVRNAGSKDRVGILRIVVYVASQAAAASISHYVELVSRLRLPKVAAGTLLAQHRIGNAVPQRLEVDGVIGTGGAIDQLPRHPYDACSRVHQALGDRSDVLGVAIAAGALRIREVAWKSDQIDVRTFLGCDLVIAVMADNTVVWRKSVRLAEAIKTCCVAVQAGATRRFSCPIARGR